MARITIGSWPIVLDQSGRPVYPGPDPIAGASTWQAVMERADWRCQCERPHPGHRGGRCGAEHHAGCRLTAGPSDPGPDPGRIISTDTAGLVAWCPNCWHRAISSARKLAISSDRTETLF